MKYDKKMMKNMAKNFKEYLDIIDKYAIIGGLTDEEYDKAKKTVEKLIKHLKNGKGDKVFDEKRYIELLQSGKLDEM